MAAVTKFGCVVTGLIWYYVATKEREDLINVNMQLRRISTSNYNSINKSEMMDEISQEQMGDVSLEELDKNISEMKNKRGTS